jgi:hypothetical protein
VLSVLNVPNSTTHRQSVSYRQHACCQQLQVLLPCVYRPAVTCMHPCIKRVPHCFPHTAHVQDSTGCLHTLCIGRLDLRSQVCFCLQLGTSPVEAACVSLIVECSVDT